ncbi:hypothetical protein [Halorubrum californiense]|uniref:hypothetical protein n=1 Tax=Halorubrum californiense TaxID=416585 RepID=UPI0018732923|nr:hypothetical protein [Halorubrum californiense]
MSTIRDETWNIVLEQIAERGEFRISDLPFEEGSRATVRRTLREMESHSWLTRDSEHSSIWRVGPKAELLLNISQEELKGPASNVISWSTQVHPDEVPELIRPPRRENLRLKNLVAEGYISVDCCSFEMSSIPTSEFRRIRRNAAASEAISEPHADLKAVGGWLLSQLGCESIEYEATYPRDGRIADVACRNAGFYVEVGMVEDVTRFYENLNIDIKTSGREIQTVYQRYPEPTEKSNQVQAMFYVPYPVDGPEKREWKSESLHAYRFTLGENKPLVSNRNNRYWGEE